MMFISFNGTVVESRIFAPITSLLIDSIDITALFFRVYMSNMYIC